MQRRLLAFFLPVLLLTAACFGGLLAAESARRISLEEANTRHAEAEQLLAGAVAAVAADREPDQPETDRRQQRSIYLAVDGRPVSGELTPQGAARDRLDQALAVDTTIWPWTDGDFATVVGATPAEGPSAGRRLELTVLQSADPVQAAVGRRWLLIGAALATVMALIAAVTYPLTRWALRPIARLGHTTSALADGDMTARADADHGPPEIRRLAVGVNAMAERVDAGLQRERAFVASASHHFGNLLTPLRLRLETLGQNHRNRTATGRPDPAVEEALAELDRLESAAERLLQLNRSEEDDGRPLTIEVGTVVDESVRSWRVVAESRGIVLRRSGSETAWALASPGAVEETLDNLIDNAMKYAEGSEITLGVMRGLHNVRVTVSDRGPGLTDEEIEHAQGRFWRGPTQQNKPGSGLGLAIVDALAAQSGGHFEMRNSPDGGLEAALVLKRAPAPQH